MTLSVKINLIVSLIGSLSQTKTVLQGCVLKMRLPQSKDSNRNVNQYQIKINWWRFCLNASLDHIEPELCNVGPIWRASDLKSLVSQHSIIEPLMIISVTGTSIWKLLDPWVDVSDWHFNWNSRHLWTLSPHNVCMTTRWIASRHN